MIRNVRDFTPEFLSQVFRVSMNNQSITVNAVNPVRLSFTTAYTALLYRLKIEYKDAKQRGPLSAIAKLPDDSSNMGETRRTFQPGTKE
jgi:hypothetical protein